MARLIDADALFDELLKRQYSEQTMGFVASYYPQMRAIVANAPAVDAVEVVHGRWEDEHGGKYANPRYRCSVCKARALYKVERDLLDNWKEVQALTPACPYCMAKLDGEIENTSDVWYKDGW